MMADLSNMSPQAMAAWDALIQSWGRPLTPTSAYRDPSYNASVGGARGSQHIHGNAFDISTAGMSAEERAALIQAAKAAGFQGFGGYDNSLHFDVGAPRTWGSDYTGATTPDWLTAALGSQPSTQSSTFRSNKMPMTPQQPQGILGSLGIQKQDPNAAGETALPFYQRDRFKDTMGNLAMAFNELRMNPSQVIPQVVQNNRERRQTTAAGNRTIEWLAQQPGGEAYVQMIQAGGSPTAVLQAYQQARSGGETPAAFAALDRQARAAGLGPGTPEYREFMLYGGAARDNTPAAFVALDLQAKAAGFEPGTPEYEDFMRTRGAGAVAEARALGAAQGEAGSKLAGVEVAMNRALDLIDLVRNDPALESMVGPIQGRMPNVSADAARFQSRLDQLQGTAFLEAYNMLRGGGQITEIEGQKAERAMARLNTAQKEEDFLQALNEFEDAIRTGYAKIQASSGGAATSTPNVAAQPTAIDNDPLGLRG